MSPSGAPNILETRVKASSPIAISWGSLAFLRFFLAWIVLAGHLTLYTDQSRWAAAFDLFDGKAAVVGFLLVSGYSIAASIEREGEGFYRRRFLRIYPLYFFAVSFAVALEAWTGGHLRLPEGETLNSVGWLADAGNFLFLQTFLVKPIQFDGPVWSLAIEVFYYALAPLFVRLGRNWLFAIISISLVSYALPKHYDWGLGYLVLSKFNALNYIWCWLVGFLLWRDRSPGTIAFALIGVLQMIFVENTPGPLAVVTYILTLTLLAFAHKIRLPVWLGPTADYLGDVSYPLYLFHFPALIMCHSILRLRSPDALALLAMAMSIISLHVIDRFIKRRYIAPLLFPASLSSASQLRIERNQVSRLAKSWEHRRR